jgi:hypothetical protein
VPGRWNTPRMDMVKVRLSYAIEFSGVLYLAQDCSWTNRRGDVVALKVNEGGVSTSGKAFQSS